MVHRLVQANVQAAHTYVETNLISLTPIGVLSPDLLRLDGSTSHHIEKSGIYLAHVSAKSPSNMSPNPSEVVPKVLES